jgi:hypothetical protein
MERPDSLSIFILDRAYAYSATPTLRHSSAQRLQASAQRRQCSDACFSHSSAQAVQISAQSWQTKSTNSLSRAINEAVKRQKSAQSMSCSMQVRIIGLASLSQAIAQLSHASAAF